MFEITVFSVFTTSLFLSVLMLIFMAVTSSKKVISKLPMWAVIAFVLFISIRLLLPFEADFTKPIRSYVILPKIDYNVLPEEKSRFIIILLLIIALIWATGSIISFYKYLKDYFLLCKVSEQIPETDNPIITKTLNKVKEDNGFHFKTRVIMNEGVDFPCEFGIFKQTVFLNSADYSENELYYILFHELSHFKNGSNRINLFLNVLTSVYWWNPIVKLFKKHMECLLEIYTDRCVSVKLSEKEKVNYLKCLYNVMENISGFKSGNAILTSAIGSFSHKAAVNRFKLIASKNKVSLPVGAAAFVITTVGVFLSVWFVIQPAYEPPESDLMPMEVEFTTENSYIVKEGDRYVLYYNGERLISNTDINKIPAIKAFL